MENWDEVRTAFHVARMGTVSGAAEALGVHHATVIRHIDALEAQLGVKLFQRHPRGYNATEAGLDLLQVAQATDDQFAQLAGRIKGQGESVSGELVVTSLGAFASLITPVLADLQKKHAGLTIKYLNSERLFRLEYGEAHVAVRTGPVPEQPDNVVQPLMQMQSHLVASQSYIERHGMPKDTDDLVNHYFVGVDPTVSRAPFNSWLEKIVPSERITFRTDDTNAMFEAVMHGAGIGLVATTWLKKMPGLTEIIPPKLEWCIPSWLVTHVDLHRTTKVQAVLAALKAAAVDWQA
ncbi:LysR family transcriptional regulator [Flavimaricola marinus]|uniref:HTH-type transcriptional regulator DmlR n=1 Tax=Flavimaricola marinus TaxID=1819565 RepID=A0A238L9E4_9RHOB|nr:LysR family transcriptional regulator [Flavimaricola marinus]SMY06221.1 HTH-type transcriptional regulator DmlR [Flavimaricola marinus]